MCFLNSENIWIIGACNKTKTSLQKGNKASEVRYSESRKLKSILTDDEKMRRD